MKIDLKVPMKVKFWFGDEKRPPAPIIDDINTVEYLWVDD